ncbi:MAG: hypothetical protein KF850_09825 [Labilithrix sp.]|nr:hypothetical protein [Labilithrix sp.]
MAIEERNESVSDGASRASATCLLLVGDRVVLRGTAPPETEYAMFEIGEIELRASEPGRVREHGYQTTADLARARLAHLGMTPALARELAESMQPVLTDAYARGLAVRRVARYLGPGELFQSDGYDGAAHLYRGVFLDLATLARDLEMEHASATLHALYLATILESEPDDTTILLSTDACTKGGKPGARTYKRPAFADPKRLANALGGLAHRAPKPDIHDALPRADVIAFLRTRADAAPDDDARALYRSLEGKVSLRDMPEKGPLASADLWAIETRLEAGELDGAIDAVDEAERRHGRTPGTTYLRARAALAMRLEPAKLVAERVSALALSMTSFQELALLAAEAWLDARRAMPYARDISSTRPARRGACPRAAAACARWSAAGEEAHADRRAGGRLFRRPPAALAADIAAVMPPVIDALDDLGFTLRAGRQGRRRSASRSLRASSPTTSSRRRRALLPGAVTASQLPPPAAPPAMPSRSRARCRRPARGAACPPPGPSRRSSRRSPAPPAAAPGGAAVGATLSAHAAPMIDDRSPLAPPVVPAIDERDTPRRKVSGRSAPRRPTPARARRLRRSSRPLRRPIRQRRSRSIYRGPICFPPRQSSAPSTSTRRALADGRASAA